MAESSGEFSISNVLFPINIGDIKEEFEDYDYVDNKISLSETIIRTNGSILQNNSTEANILTTAHDGSIHDEIKQEISVPDIKIEFNNKILVCNNCHEDYQDYCTKCGMLRHILNPCTNISDIRNEIPKDILEIQNSCQQLGVFSLKIIPDGVKFGPFTGLATAGNCWTINNGKLRASDNMSESLNWMQHINCAKTVFEQNLTAFQYRGFLYYRSSRTIWPGEELLVYFGEKHIYCLDENLEVNFIPERIEKSSEDVYACVFCCLGFSAKSYLLEHKACCPYSIDEKFFTAVFIQCQYCDIYFKEKEYFEYHRNYCAKNVRELAQISEVVNTGIMM